MIEKHEYLSLSPPSFSLSILQSRSQENNRKKDEKVWEHILLQEEFVLLMICEWLVKTSIN